VSFLALSDDVRLAIIFGAALATLAVCLFVAVIIGLRKH